MDRMNNLGNVTKKYLQLNPVNATSGGSFSFRNGLPLIKFDIAASALPNLLDGKELRLNGKLTTRRGDNNTNIDANVTCFNDNFAGNVYQCIDTITVASKRLNSVLERINMTNRLVPSLISTLNDGKKIDTKLAVGGKHKSTIPLTRHNLTTYNVVDSNGQAPAANTEKGVDFSLPIYAGIFHSGEDIDLSSISGVGGLTIEILLKSDTNVVFGAAAATQNATYTLSDLMLTAPVYEMGGESAAALQNKVNQFNFNTWSSMFQTVNSSASVISFTPGLSRVSSVFMNTVTASDLGNQNFNSCRLGPVGELRQLRFSKNGALLPLQYRLQTVEQNNNDNAKVDAGVDTSFHTNSMRVSVNRNVIEGIRTDRYNKVNDTSLSYNNWGAGSVDVAQNTGRTGVEPGGAFGFGILYDAYGAGQDFSNMVWSCEFNFSGGNQLTPGLAAVPPATVAGVANNLDGTAATAQSVNIYFLNKNTLVFNANGIDVQR